MLLAYVCHGDFKWYICIELSAHITINISLGEMSTWEGVELRCLYMYT